MLVFLAEEIRTGVAEPEDDEKIDLLHLPLSELLAMIDAGKILDGKTILSVLLYASQRGMR
jgi:ADP-ribose pyrophosphatase